VCCGYALFKMIFIIAMQQYKCSYIMTVNLALAVFLRLSQCLPFCFQLQNVLTTPPPPKKNVGLYMYVHNEMVAIIP